MADNTYKFNDYTGDQIKTILDNINQFTNGAVSGSNQLKDYIDTPDDTKADKVGPIPTFTVSAGDNIGDFLSANDVFNKLISLKIEPIAVTFGNYIGTFSSNQFHFISAKKYFSGTGVNYNNLKFGNVFAKYALSPYRSTLEDDSNKVALGSSNTTDQYPNAKSVWDECVNIREVAEDKCKTWVLSYQTTIVTLKSEITNGAKVYYYGEDISQNILDGDYDNEILLNTSFNSQDISFGLLDQDQYIVVFDGNTDGGNIKYRMFNIDEGEDLEADFHTGDIFLVIETDVPKRWYNTQNLPSLFFKWEDKPNLIEITWAALKDLRDDGELIPGKFYRITDYECTTTEGRTSSAGHQFDIIVRADSYGTLNEEASAIQHVDNNYFNNSKLKAWKLWYCLDNDTNRFAWAKDENCLFTDDDLWFTPSGTTTINGQAYYLWYNSYFADDESGCYLGSTKAKPEIGDTLDEISADKQSIVEVDYSSVDRAGESGKGVIYRMIDEFNNDVPYDFKNILFTRNDIYGTYTNKYTFDFNSEDNIDFDLSLNQLHNNNGSNQEIGCHGNIIKPYYNQIDNTDSGYGWKQFLNFIVFNNYEDFHEYAFTYCNYSNFFDFGCRNITFGKCSSLNHFCCDCRYMNFGNNCNYNIFNSNCYYNTFAQGCNSNTFGNECYNNTFESNCSNNTFGNYCHTNTFRIGCAFNRFRDLCYRNTFGDYCHTNTFGKDCSNNTFGSSCYKNTFGNNCYRNTFEDACPSNTFGNDCFYNTFGSSCPNNTFGNNCDHNIFGTSSSPISNCQYIIIDNGCKYLYITSQDSESVGHLRNIHIHLGVKGTSSNYKTITVDRNLAYETNIVPAGTTTIEV